MKAGEITVKLNLDTTEFEEKLEHILDVYKRNKDFLAFNDNFTKLTKELDDKNKYIKLLEQENENLRGLLKNRGYRV